MALYVDSIVGRPTFPYSTPATIPNMVPDLCGLLCVYTCLVMATTSLKTSKCRPPGIRHLLGLTICNG